MFSFQSIASGSAGNCHHLKTDDTFGLIDIGIQWKRVQKAVDFKTSSLDFALATHRHLDHSRYIKDAIGAGIDVYAVQDVWDSNGIKGHRAHTIEPMKRFTIKSLTILPFPVPHDVDNVGFLIADKHGDKLLYATDLYYSSYVFQGVTIMAVECNYSRGILEENIEAGVVSPAQKKRILRSHMSLENLIDFLHACDLSRTQEIHLLHLSNDNSDAALFRSEVEEATGKPVYIAQ